MANDVQRSLGRIEGNLLEVAVQLKLRHERDDKRHDELETRVRRVEHRQHWYSGAAAVIGIAFGAVAKKFM